MRVKSKWHKNQVKTIEDIGGAMAFICWRITKNHLEDLINEGFVIEKTDELLVVDFWATWCGPCQQFAPTFKQVAAQLEPKARFIKIETEKEQAISAKYNIRSIPTLAMFKNGQEIDRVSGALSAPDFTNWVNQYL